ncbi:MAG TPA: hypothetical protein VD999_03325 [Vitreimonas sp.]|nr:hypothetical protein [Vitreimonas sp.]
MNTASDSACSLFTDKFKLLRDHHSQLEALLPTLIEHFSADDLRLVQDKLSELERLKADFSAEFKVALYDSLRKSLLGKNPTPEVRKEVNMVLNNAFYNEEKAQFVMVNLNAKTLDLDRVPSIVTGVELTITVNNKLRSLNQIKNCNTLHLFYAADKLDAPQLTEVFKITDAEKPYDENQLLTLSFPKLWRCVTGIKLKSNVIFDAPLLREGGSIKIDITQPLHLPSLQKAEKLELIATQILLPQLTTVNDAIKIGSSIPIYTEIFSAPLLKKAKSLQLSRIDTVELPALSEIEENLGIVDCTFFSFPQLTKVKGKIYAPGIRSAEEFFLVFPNLTEIGDDRMVSITCGSHAVARALETELDKRGITHTGRIEP